MLAQVGASTVAVVLAEYSPAAEDIVATGAGVLTVAAGPVVVVVTMVSVLVTVST
jgi:hypothetical protein